MEDVLTQLSPFREFGLVTLFMSFVAFIIWQMLNDRLVSGDRLKKEEAKNDRLLTTVETQKETIGELTGQVRDLSENIELVIEQSKITNTVLDGLRKVQSS